MKTLLLILSLIFAVQGSDLVIHLYNDKLDTGTHYNFKGSDSTVVQVKFVFNTGEEYIVNCNKSWLNNNELFLFAPWFPGMTVISNVSFFQMDKVLRIQ